MYKKVFYRTNLGGYTKINSSGGVTVKLSHGWDRIIRDIPHQRTSSPLSKPTDQR